MTTNGEAQAINTLLDYLLNTHSPGLHVPTDEQALASATWLADRANRTLMAGLTADRVTAAWPGRRPAPHPTAADAKEVRVEHGSLYCPYCGAGDEIAEVDRAERQMTLALQDTWVTVNIQDAEWKRVRFMCAACYATVRLPEDLRQRLHYVR